MALTWVKCASSGPEIVKARMALDWTTDYMSANITIVRGTSHTSTRSREGEQGKRNDRGKRKGVEWYSTIVSASRHRKPHPSGEPAETGHLHDGTDWVRVERCAFVWLHHANRIKRESGGTGTGGTADLEFPLCGCTIGKGLGGDDGELTTATMVTIGLETPHATHCTIS